MKDLQKIRMEKLKNVQTYEELLEVALWEIRSGDFNTMISFPIYTGGLGNSRDNIQHALKFMQYMETKGHRAWSQIPYLNENLKIAPAMSDIRSKFARFYLPLIRSHAFAHHVMMPGWESSRGCRTEHEEAITIGANVLYIDRSWEK